MRSHHCRLKPHNKNVVLRANDARMDIVYEDSSYGGEGVRR